MADGEDLIHQYSTDSNRDIAIRIQVAISGMEALKNLKQRSFDLAREHIFIVALVDGWIKHQNRDLFHDETIMKFYTNSKKIPLKKALNEYRERIAPNLGRDLALLTRHEGTKSVEESLSRTMSIYDICQDVEFLRNKRGDITVAYSKKRRNMGIHYTPWDLSVNMATKLLNTRQNPSKILDPAIGSGAFLVACKFSMKEHQHELYGGDVDPAAVFSTRLQLKILEPTSVDDDIVHRIKLVDFLSPAGLRSWQNEEIEAIIMNPPYVPVSGESLLNYTQLNLKTLSCRNLYAYFVEQAFHLLGDQGSIVAIVPINIATGGKNFNSIRRLILKKSKRLAMKHIDTVPGYLFNQGKLEPGSGSKSVSTRTTIFEIELGEGSIQIESTRFIRWKNEDRTPMLRILPQPINEENVDNFSDASFPMGGALDHELLAKLRGHPVRLDEKLSKTGEYAIQVLKPVRYYTAVGIDNHQRDNTITLNFDTIVDRNAALAMLVSNMFFWWWRTHGNGQQLRTKEVFSLPWPEDEQSVKLLAGIGDQMIAMSDDEQIRVTTTNKGSYNSLAYRHGIEAISNADDILITSFQLHKENISDFFASTRYPEHRYYHKLNFQMKNIMKHTTPSNDRERVLHVIMDTMKHRRDNEPKYMSMQDMYDIIFSKHDDQDDDFELTPIQLMKHKQRSGPVEEHFKHDLKNSLSNAKSKGLVINPKRDQWGWPEPALYRDEIQDVICWEQIVQAARTGSTQNKRYEFTQISTDEIRVGKPGTEDATYSINQKLVETKVMHLLNCGGVMDSAAFHSWTVPRDAIIDLHPNLDYTKGSKKIRVRYYPTTT